MIMSDSGEVERREIVIEDNDDRKIIHTEYWQHNKMLSRDVVIVVKKMPELFGSTLTN